MNQLDLILVFFFLLSSTIPFKLEEDKYYFQLSPSENLNQPNLYTIYKLNSENHIINTTEGENPKIIDTVKTTTTPIKELSSIIKFHDKFLVKTCFGPDKILEIIDENGQIYTPQNDYFTKVKNNLENIKFCYSTAVMHPVTIKDFLIYTYWTESATINGNETYSHKFILFHTVEKTFSEVFDLDPQKNNFYAQSCTTLGNLYIYCTIASSLALSKKYHFSIDSSYAFAKTKEIKMVSILARFSNSIYHQPIGIFKQTYTKTGKTAHYFLTEYHDKDANKTRLMTSVYINYYLMSFILRFEGLGIYYGINIEDFYVDPNLFNHLLPNNEELLIIYITKGENGKNNLLLNRYDYNQSLQVQTKFDKYTLSNYLREDICINPKYMQSMFITSFISYDANDKQIIQSSPEGTYYKFQKDIGTIIACAEEDGSVSYDIKKIKLPQCLNILDELNGKSGSLFLSSEQDTIILDIKNNPNFKSLRNVEIELLDSNIYNTIFIIIYTKDGIKQPAITQSQTISNIDSIEFIPTSNYKKGKTYQIPYKIKQTGFSGISSTCHLTSDICYFEINYKIETGIASESIQIEEEDCTVDYCKECENNKCIECDENIIGIKLNKKKNQCVCDEDNGFDKEPNTNLSMCLCKDEYSFYQDISTCLPDFILNSGDYCITGQDEKSLIYIYDKVPIGMTKYYEDGLPYCKTTQVEECISETWFKMGKYQFNYAKIDKCVYIIFNDSIIMFSNMSECEYKYYDYKNCLNLNINNEEEYYAALKNAYEYVPDDNSSSLNITIDDNVKFYILNEYTKKKISSVHLSNSCIKMVEGENNLQSLLIFVANIKKPNIRSTQVEYGFYNPVPEYMYKELDMSICYNQEKQTEINVTDLPEEEEEEEENEWEIRRRRLQLPSEENNNDDNKYDINMDEVIVNVQIDWTDENMKIIQELYIDRDINIFDAKDDFYNDVCNKFTSPEKTDVYLQDRREKYFITESICESKCVQIGYDIETSRAVCKCKIKESPNNFENVTFASNNLEDHFKKKYKLPNLKVMKCLFKINFIKNGGQIFAFLLIIAFIILNCCRYYHIIDLNKEKNKNKINNIESCNQNIKDSPEEENIYKSNKKCRKERCLWEVPIEELLDKIRNIEEEEKKKQKEKEEEGGKIEAQDEDEGLGFRVPKERTEIKKFDNRIKNKKKDKSEKKKGMIEALTNSINSNSEETDGNSALKMNGNGGKNEGKNNIVDQTNQDTTFNISNQNNNDNDKNSNINNDDILGYKRINKLKESLNKNVTNPSNDTQSVNPHNDEIDPYSKDAKEEEKRSEIEKNNQFILTTSQNNSSQFNVPKEQSEDNNKPPEETNDNDNNLIKFKKKKKKKNPSNPPPKDYSNADNNKNPPSGNQSDRDELNRKKRKEKGEDDNKDCDELFKKYVYIVKRDTQNANDLHDFITSEENNDNAQNTFLTIFLSKYIGHSTLFFIIPWIFCTKYDKDTYYIKLTVLLLYIAFYMAFNIFTEFKLTTLHLYIQKWMYENSSFVDIFINTFLPFIILYIPIAWLKKSLSITVFYIQEENIIESYKKGLDYFSIDSKIYNRILKVYLKGEESKIKKFRNNNDTNNKIIILYGSVLLLFNWYLATTFCGIYHNSFGCIVVNVLISMALTIGFSLLLHLISTILKYIKFFSGGFCFVISECFNCKKIVDLTFFFICKISYCLCCECYKEEFYSSKNDIDTRDKIEEYMRKYNNNNENQEIKSSNPDIVKNQNTPIENIINNIKQYA